jgi:hypothetical protein
MTRDREHSAQVLRHNLSLNLARLSLMRTMLIVLMLPQPEKVQVESRGGLSFLFRLSEPRFA